MSKTKVFRFRNSAAFALSALAVFVFCVGDDNPAAGGKKGNELVLGANEAWVSCMAAGICSGYIFESGGDLKTGTSVDNGATWTWSKAGTWSADGSNVTMTIAGAGAPVPYSVSGNKLSLGGMEYEKRSIGGTGGGDGSALVLGANEAWVSCMANVCNGYVFESNKDLMSGSSVDNGATWTWGKAGTWSADGSNLTMTAAGGVPIPYGISGGKLTIAAIVYEKRTVDFDNGGDNGNGGNNLYCDFGSGACVPITVAESGACIQGGGAVVSVCGGNNGGGNLVLGANEAWVVCEDIWCVGFIFEANGDLALIAKNNGAWYGGKAGVWSVSGNMLTTIIDYGSGPEIETGAYTVSGATLTMNQDGELITLTKTPGITYSDTDIGIPEYTLTVSANPPAGGTVSPSGTVTYSAGMNATVKATPAQGFRFAGWSGASTSKNATVDIAMDGNKALVANFEPIPVTNDMYCDYGFGKCEAIASNSECDTDIGVITTACGSGGTYCDFGQPDQHGSGGCNFAPFSVPAGGYSWTATGPGWINNLTGRCSNKDDDWGWAKVVTQEGCIASNTLNPCITDPLKPGDWGGSGPYCKGGNDPLLVCAAGEVWVDAFPAGERDGFIFLANGNLQWIDDSMGYWTIYETGRWSTSENQLTILIPGDLPLVITYSVSGNRLNLGGSIHTKITGVTVHASAPKSLAKSRAERKSVKKSLLSR